MSTILVTGTSSGIGEYIAQYLLTKPSVNVIGVSRRGSPESLASNSSYTHITGDLTKQSTIDAIAEKVGAKLDGAVFNAGVLDCVKKLSDTDIDSFKWVFDVNLFSVVELTKALIPALKAAKGKAIYVSSGASTNGYQAWSAYGASKAALNLVVSTLATEEPEITAVSVAPGVVDTDMQVLIRGKADEQQMSSSDMEKFHSLKRDNNLVDPRDSGKTYGDLALYAPKELSGKYLRYNDPEVTSVGK